MQYRIREIEAKDNARVEFIIRTCLLEFGGNREGLAWCDPDLGRFSEVYAPEKSAYWVAEEEDGTVVGGVGIGPLPGAEGVCELQKMYCLPQARGTGAAHLLMATAMEFARLHYQKCYLETLSNMTAANRFYQKYGFQRLERPYVETEHFACDVWYLLSFS